MKFIFLILFSHSTWAQVLLIPDAQIDYEKYKSHCTKEGYQCTMNYFLQQVQQVEPTHFNDLLNQLDYSSETFKSQFLTYFYAILKEDSLSIDQAEILLKILQQIKDFSDSQKQKNFQTLENQLSELIKLVKANEISELPAHYLIVLKKPVAVEFQKKWRSEFFKVNILKIEFNRTLETENHDLVQGECEQAYIHPSLQISKWQIDSETRCSFAERLTAVQSSTTEYMGEHKNTLITTGLVIVGVAIFLNQYEVKFNF